MDVFTCFAFKQRCLLAKEFQDSPQVRPESLFSLSALSTLANLRIVRIAVIDAVFSCSHAIIAANRSNLPEPPGGNPMGLTFSGIL
jgi:hypothetical protein